MAANPAIEAHKTAIRRVDLSRPLKAAIQDGVLLKEDSLFDYGCGLGDDISILGEQGYTCDGWDPTHRPKVEPRRAEIINLGFVINVIEDPRERAATLKRAYSLADKTLIVSALLDLYANKSVSLRPHGDGFLTTRNTFQKLYSQLELREYIKDTLGEEPLPAAPGVFFLFKDLKRRESFLASKTRRRVNMIFRRKLSVEEKYAPHKKLLEGFAETVAHLGRLPVVGEYPHENELKKKVGSFNRAYGIVQHLFPEHRLEEYRTKRHEDLLVYLALSNFRKLPQFKNLERSIQCDLKTFFGGYRKAQDAGEELLFGAGDPRAIAEACRTSRIGKKLPQDLYVHADYIHELPPLLRVYVGCAQAFAGDIEGANVIKIHMYSGKVSYLRYKNFERDPHPALQTSTTVVLGQLDMYWNDYSTRENPPILHRKETFVGKDHPKYSLFKKLTAAEETAGLLERPWEIGLKKNWETRLKAKKVLIKGHSLVKVK